MYISKLNLKSCGKKSSMWNKQNFLKGIFVFEHKGIQFIRSDAIEKNMFPRHLKKISWSEIVFFTLSLSPHFPTGDI